MMPLRPCLGSSIHPPGHTLTKGSYCPDCQREKYQARQAQRGTTTERGYGADWQQLRASVQRLMDAGVVYYCWRCTERVNPDEPWDLGHDDHDRTKYRGPEHANQCNRAAGGRAAH